MTTKEKRLGMLQFWDPSSTGALIYLHILTQSNSGALIDADFNANLDSPEVVEAIEQLMRIYKAGSAKGEVSLPFMGQVYDIFNAGRTVMIFDTAGFTAKAFAKGQPELFKSGALGFAAPPMHKQYGRYSDVVGVVAMKGDMEDETDAWIQFLFEDDNYIEFLHTIPGGMYPVTKSVAQSPAFFNHPFIKSIKEGVDLTLAHMPFGKGIGMTYGPNPSAGALGAGLIERLMQDVAINGTAPQAAAQKVNQTLETVIKRSRRG